MPENTLLSHDLFESLFARAALITDLEVLDDYPAHYDTYAKRQHRWTRGDWQIAPWLFRHVPDERGRERPLESVVKFSAAQRSIAWPRMPFTMPSDTGSRISSGCVLQHVSRPNNAEDRTLQSRLVWNGARKQLGGCFVTGLSNLPHRQCARRANASRHPGRHTGELCLAARPSCPPLRWRRSGSRRSRSAQYWRRSPDSIEVA